MSQNRTIRQDWTSLEALSCVKMWNMSSEPFYLSALYIHASCHGRHFKIFQKYPTIIVNPFYFHNDIFPWETNKQKVLVFVWIMKMSVEWRQTWLPVCIWKFNPSNWVIKSKSRSSLRAFQNDLNEWEWFNYLFVKSLNQPYWTNHLSD